MEEALDQAAETYGTPVISLNPVDAWPMRTIRKVLESVIEQVQEKHDADATEKIDGISVGLPEVDQILRGLRPGELCVVGGRPETGKTTFLIQLTGYAAAEEKRRVAVFSPKSSADALTARLLTNVGRVNRQRMESGTLNNDDWERLTFALGKLADTAIVFSDSPRLTSQQICVEAEQLANDQGLDLIVLDDFQMLSVDTSNQSLATGLNLAIRDLKILARELNVPIVVTAFLTRAVELRSNKRPILSDLRETGALEDTADTVIFLYRDTLYNPDSPSRGTVEVIVARNAKGPAGTTLVGSFEDSGSFYSLSKHDAYLRHSRS